MLNMHMKNVKCIYQQCSGCLQKIYNGYAKNVDIKKYVFRKKKSMYQKTVHALYKKKHEKYENWPINKGSKEKQ